MLEFISNSELKILDRLEKALDSSSWIAVNETQEYDDGTAYDFCLYNEAGVCLATTMRGADKADIEFMAATRKYMPKLIKEVRRLKLAHQNFEILYLKTQAKLDAIITAHQQTLLGEDKE